MTAAPTDRTGKAPCAEASSERSDEARPESAPAGGHSGEAVAIPQIPGFGAGKSGGPAPQPVDSREALDRAFRQLAEVVGAGKRR